MLKYAFVYINKDTFEIQTLQPNDAEMLAKFVALKKHNPYFKIIIAIGGWSHEYQPRFSKMAATADGRQKFIQSLVAFLKTHKVDGVSYSWIYPGTRGHGPAEEEKKKFTLLLKDTWEAFLAASNNGLNERYYISAAVTPHPDQVEKSYEIEKIKMYLDSVDVITNSLWTYKKKRTGSSTAMKSSPKPIVASVEAYIKAGMPAHKINVGFSLYGHSFTLADINDVNLGAKTVGAGSATELTRTKGVLAYYEICSRAWKHETAWYKSKTKTSYASDEYGVWVSFDDPKSLTYKLYYLLQKYNLNGVSVWSMDFDDFTGTFCNAGKYPFLRQIGATIEAIEARLPPISCRTPANIGFVLDSSLHAGWHYPKLKKFIKVVAASFGISAFGSRASVATFSDDVEIGISFSDNFDSYSFNAQLDALPLMKKKRNIAKALGHVHSDMFTEANGAEGWLPRVVVLLVTGKQSNGMTLSPGLPVAEAVLHAKALRDDGVHVVVVGVGRHVDQNELEIIAGDTQDAFIAPTYGELLGRAFVSSVNSRICGGSGSAMF